MKQLCQTQYELADSGFGW